MKAVLVHAGSRDSYQVLRALEGADLLAAFVTNVYARKWARRNYEVEVPRTKVHTPFPSFCAYALMRMTRRIDLHAWSDKILSRRALRLAQASGSSLFCYSYYAYEAFRLAAGRGLPKVLFQLHPHPVSVRRLLEEELIRIPEAKRSLCSEPDLKRTGRQFEELAEEPQMASLIFAASSFTKQTLVENGVDASRIYVVPYGVDQVRFPARTLPAFRESRLTVTWLGQLSQRKGLTYFLSAIRNLNACDIRVLLRGRGIVDQELLRRFSDLDLDIKLGLPTNRIVEDLHRSDLCVLPSLVEGFGQSVLEAMSCGVPVVTTPNTCGPDIITHGLNGFLVPVRSEEGIREVLEWSVANRSAIAAMGVEASRKASTMSWTKFRSEVAATYIRFVK